MPLLFVYGSLKRGFPLHHHLNAGTFRGVAHTEPGYALYRLGWYPGMTAEEGAGSVSGEVFEIPEVLFTLLDAVEEVPHLYQRRAVSVACPAYGCGTLRAQSYLYVQPVERRWRIPSGHWPEAHRKE